MPKFKGKIIIAETLRAVFKTCEICEKFVIASVAKGNAWRSHSPKAVIFAILRNAA